MSMNSKSALISGINNIHQRAEEWNSVIVGVAVRHQQYKNILI